MTDRDTHPDAILDHIDALKARHVPQARQIDRAAALARLLELENSARMIAPGIAMSTRLASGDRQSLGEVKA